MTDNDEKVHFKELTWPLKAAIIAMWTIGVCWILLFFSGLIGYAGG